MTGKTKTLQNFKKAKVDYEKTIKKLNDDLKTCLVEEAKQLFDKYPSINSMGVMAYTPYWNDGDECTYSACTQDPLINDDGGCDDDEEDTHPVSDVPAKAYKEVAKFFSSYPEEFYEKTFDEGIITIYRNGKVKVLEYEHD